MLNDQGVLMVRQTPTHQLGPVWTIPWGLLEPGEAPSTGALREVREEAGVQSALEGLIAAQALPPPWQGALALVFLARHVSGEPQPDGRETDAARFFSRAQLRGSELAFEPWTRWLALNVLEGHTGALVATEGNPFGAEGFIARRTGGATQLLVNIDVDDVARAERFYTTAFDFQVARRFGSGAVELVGGSSRLYLLEKAAGTPATGAPDSVRGYARHWTPVHFDVVVEDIDLALPRAVAAGAVLERPVQASNWGRLARLADPFGHGICLVQFVGRGYDEIAAPATVTR